MKRALSILAIGAALTGCATTAPGQPAHVITTSMDWLGPDPKGQYEACQDAYRAQPNAAEPIRDRREAVIVDGTAHTVEVSPMSEGMRTLYMSDRIRYTNACMSGAGYTYRLFVDRFEAAFNACEPVTQIHSEDRKACLKEHMDASAKVDTDKMP